MVGVTGLEPARLAARDPKSRSSANSDIPPQQITSIVPDYITNRGRKWKFSSLFIAQYPKSLPFRFAYISALSAV